MSFEDGVFGTVRRYASVFLRLALGAAFERGLLIGSACGARQAL